MIIGMGFFVGKNWPVWHGVFNLCWGQAVRDSSAYAQLDVCSSIRKANRMGRKDALSAMLIQQSRRRNAPFV